MKLGNIDMLNFLKNSIYQNIIEDKQIQYFLHINELTKENLYENTNYLNQLKYLRKYLIKPSHEKMLDLFYLAATPFERDTEEKNLLFFYCLNKRLVSFNLRRNIESAKISTNTYFLKTPSNTIESIFSSIITSYLSEQQNINKFDDDKKKERNYLLKCFTFMCENLTQEETLLIKKESLFYWQNFNMFFQPQYTKEINSQLILPLIKSGLNMEYLKSPTFTQCDFFMNNIQEVFDLIDKEFATMEKIHLENHLFNHDTIQITSKKLKL